MSWDRDDPDAPWITGRYDSGDPEQDAIARRVFLDRQRRLGLGWHRRGWQDPGALLRQLEDQALDPGQVRAEARRIEARRLGAADRRNLTGHEALIMCEALGIAGVGHEPGWPG